MSPAGDSKRTLGEAGLKDRDATPPPSLAYGEKAPVFSRKFRSQGVHSPELSPLEKALAGADGTVMPLVLRHELMDQGSIRRTIEIEGWPANVQDRQFRCLTL